MYILYLWYFFCLILHVFSTRPVSAISMEEKEK